MTPRSSGPARLCDGREQPSPELGDSASDTAHPATLRLPMAEASPASGGPAPAAVRAPQSTGRRSPTRLRFARFAAVGVANTAVTFAVFNLCTAALHVPAAEANVLGWLAGFANSFVWNRSWTFRDRRDLPARRILPRFALASLAALAVSEGVLVGLHAAVFASRLGIQVPRAVALNAIEVAAIGCSLCVSYALSAAWAFRTA